MEKDKQKPAPDASLLLALRCSRASLLLSSLRQPHAPMTRRRSSATDRELRADGLLRAELAAARREAGGHARIYGSELLLVLALVPVLLLLLLLGLFTAAAAAA